MKFSVVLSLAIFVTLLTGTYFVKKSDFYKFEDKEITYVLREWPEFYDPAVAFDDYSLRVTDQVFEPLYQYHYLKRPYEVIPLLAVKMPEVSNDGKKYTIQIKKNIRYHYHPAFKGKKRYVVAQDFIRQIKRLAFKPIKSRGTWVFEDRLKGFSSFRNKVNDNFESFEIESISGLRAIDDHTLEFELTKRDEQFIHFLTMSFVVPLPEEVMKLSTQSRQFIQFGTGPYKLDKFVEDGLKLIKFDDYRDDIYPRSGDRYAYTEKLLNQRREEIPFINKVYFKVMILAKDRWESALDGDIDIVENTKSYVSELDKRVINKDGELERIKVQHSPSLSARWLAFNMRDPILGKEKGRLLRLAIAHAIDRREYIQRIKKNTCLEAHSIYNPGVLGYDPSHQLPFEFNLNRAKQLLVEAGYPNGEGLPTIVYSTRSDGKERVAEGHLIKEQLAKVGINIEIEILKFKQFLKRSRAGELQFWTGGWIYDYPDAENLLQLLVGRNHPGNNKTGYHSSLVDNLYDKYTKEKSTEIRASYLSEIQKQIMYDLPWIMMIYETNYLLLSKRVRNYRHSSIIRNNIKYLDLD